MNSLERRAARGAAFMDREQPGWENHINLATLDIGDNKFCILGQCCGEYNEGIQRLCLAYRPQMQYGLGFIAGGKCYQYPELTEAWIREIIFRLVHKITPAKAIQKPKRSAVRRMQPTHS